MAQTSVLVLFNQPLLAKDHPDAESEHTVVAIAEHLARILNEEGFRADLLALAPDPALLWHTLQRHKPDVVFNLYEGNLDNADTESYVAGLLDWAGVPYTGSPFATLTVARMKPLTKYLLKGAGLPTADFQVVHRLPLSACALPFPVIVKPAAQDASVGVDQKSVCTCQAEVDERVRYLLATYGAPVLIEEYIPGREFNVALMELPELEALPLAEIVLPAQKPGSWSILTYAGKWKVGTPEYDETPSRFPTDLSAAAIAELNRLAMTTYRLLGCRDYARVDFRMRPDGRAYILEVNPNPEISEDANFTGCLGSARRSHRDFIVRLVNQALSRKHVPKPTFAPR
jgi:D-alanine-D-alanine ligase